MARFAILIVLAATLAAQIGKNPNTPVFSGLPDKTPKSDLRSIHGQILDPKDAPVEKAVVYLKNVRNLKIITFITGKDGSYHFNGLSTSVDYELHAEAENHRGASNTRTVSLLDGRKDVSLNLRVEEKKKDEKPDDAKKPDDDTKKPYDTKKKPGV
jgi:hypothetical protein